MADAGPSSPLTFERRLTRDWCRADAFVPRGRVLPNATTRRRILWSPASGSNGSGTRRCSPELPPTMTADVSRTLWGSPMRSRRRSGSTVEADFSMSAVDPGPRVPSRHARRDQPSMRMFVVKPLATIPIARYRTAVARPGTRGVAEAAQDRNGGPGQGITPQARAGHRRRIGRSSLGALTGGRKAANTKAATTVSTLRPLLKA
jgi:hypothetical protein